MEGDYIGDKFFENQGFEIGFKYEQAAKFTSRFEAVTAWSNFKNFRKNNETCYLNFVQENSDSTFSVKVCSNCGWLGKGKTKCQQ